MSLVQKRRNKVALTVPQHPLGGLSAPAQHRAAWGLANWTPDSAAAEVSSRTQLRHNLQGPYIGQVQTGKCSRAVVCTSAERLRTLAFRREREIAMAFSFNRSMLSRRAAVKTGVAAASASMAHWSFGAAAEPAARIITKPIPSTGERLPVIGVGTNAYGVAGAEGLAARREVLKRMPELGASVVDTAASYGRSEEVIGDIVEALGNRGRLFIATKLAEATPRAGLASIEASFFKLQTDRIDLMQIHRRAWRRRDCAPPSGDEGGAAYPIHWHNQLERSATPRAGRGATQAPI